MKLAKFATGALFAALAVGFVAPAQAQLLGSNVRIRASNGFSGGGFICKSADRFATVNGGGELLGSDWVGPHCVGYYSVDVSDYTLTMTALEGGNYSFADFNMEIVNGPAITGLSFLGFSGNFFNPNYPMNQTNFAPVTTVGVTPGGNSFLDILWDTGSDNNQFAFMGPDSGGDDVGTVTDLGTATFSFTTQDSSVTPEPATVALLAPGLAAMAGMARRRKKNSPA